MTKETSLDEVAEAVEAVREMQGQIRTMLEAIIRLVDRIEALEKAGEKGAPGKRANV